MISSDNTRVTYWCCANFALSVLCIWCYGLIRAIISMSKRGNVLRCALINCNKTTDNKRQFGQIHRLNEHQRSSCSAWLQQPHDGVVCHCHYTALH